MSTSTGEKQECDTKTSCGGIIMDSLPFKRYETQDDQLFAQPRPVASSLSRLAELISHFQYKPKQQQPSSSICKDCGQTFPNLDSLVAHQESEHSLQKLHCCQRCGQKFALLSSLQLHNCPDSSSTCQACRGEPQWGCPCPACGAEPLSAFFSKEPIFDNDNSPYVCAPCGLAFSLKQELLYHQQAGECQPAPLNPSSPAARPTASYTSSPPSPTCTRVSPSSCTLCPRTFRSAAGLASHTRNFHKTTFQCRSCDKVFPLTSLLYRHREEEHRREKIIAKPQRNSRRETTRRRQRGETYPCLHCGKVFLHHLTRRAHFKHYSAHHEAHLALSSKTPKPGLKPKAVNGSKLLKEVKRKRGRPRKIEPALTEEEVETGDRSQAVLKAHEKVPQPADTCRCCSVCTDGITLSEIPEVCDKNVYHCVPCAEAFMALETFLEHCQKHLIREREEDEDLLSD
ncbi:oocyte zinc finger protein XlCOF7.1 [Triplophysa dalaica]|uniref:oocyte zinc finger protein XlCOF7.1 n=1 Tax=Triplophysa dalaica TaxID=1582913 RepID=UPI0024DFA7AC|nr:oocyte zinc finger protein XlCOF7.1 [Triplophysa dalaica]